VERSDCGLVEVLSQYPGGIGRTQKTLVAIAGILGDIWTEHLRNTILERYCYTNLHGDNFCINTNMAVTRYLRLALGVVAINNEPLEKIYAESRRLEIYILGVKPVFVTNGGRKYWCFIEQFVLWFSRLWHRVVW
jgi:hypothetical protein